MPRTLLVALHAVEVPLDPTFQCIDGTIDADLLFVSVSFN
jgi:hypothetical protein